MKKTILLFALLASASVSAQTVDPATQINWPRVTGSGAPTLSCTSGNYGQPYTDTAATPNAYYVCGATGWQKLSFAAEHNGTAFAVPGLANFLDTPTGGIPAGYQAVTPSVDSSSGIGFYTASTAGQVQQLPTGLPASGQYVILYPQSGSTSCSGGGNCSYAVGPGAWMQMSNTGVIFGPGSSITETGTALPAGVLDANVTAAYNCSTGYASGYGAKSIPNAALTSANISYATYCVKVASGPGYNYAGATWQSSMSCSSGCGGQSMFSFAQPFMVVYYSGTPVVTNYLSFAAPLIVQGQTVGLATGWPSVIDTGTANAYVSQAPWVTQLNPGQEAILVAANANTGASTFVFNGAPAANIVKAGGAALAAGDITTTAPALLIYQANGTWLDVDPQTAPAGTGTVTSVGLSVPSWLTVAGSPVTSSGTLAVSATTGQTANEALMTPNGAAGAVALRALVNGDLPTSGATAGNYTNANITVNAQGIVTAASNGSAGSGLPSCAAGQMVYYASSGSTGTCLSVGTNLSISSGTLNASDAPLPSGVNGQILTNNGSGAANYAATSPTIGVANGGASITTAYTLKCDSSTASTGIQDRGTWAIVGSGGSVVVPDLGGTGCSGMYGGVLNSNSSSITISRQTSDTLNCYTPGSAPSTGQTSCTVPAGSWAAFSPNKISATAYDVKIVPAPGVGTITGVTAGTGLSGGGTSGNVTVNLSTPVSAANGGTGTSAAIFSCTEVWSGSGTSSALQSGDDAVSNNTCYNDSGATRTITAVKCRSSAASNTTTVNPTFGGAGTGTTVLSAALTCGSSYAYSASGTVSSGSWTTGTGIDPGMGGTLTGSSISMIVEYHY